MRIVCVGDIHLGKRPSGLPPGLAEHEITLADLSPVRAWNDTIRWAVENRVDGVLLAGDVVHHTHDRFEAFGHLSAGVQRLVDAGISVFAVAGNHDGVVLPRLARHIPELNLLGAGGEWEKRRMTSRDGQPVDILGWSFPGESFPGNPASSMPITLKPGVPTIGLLHGDLDGSAGTRYAPVPRADLERAGALLWVLGHIHRPSDWSACGPIGYLGSLVGMTPNETGRHGPWLLTIEPDGAFTMRQLALAPIRWEQRHIPGETLAGGDGDHEDVKDSLQAAIEEQMAGMDELVQGEDCLRVLACRFRITGHCACRREVQALREELLGYIRPSGRYVCCIEDVIDESRPAIDLAALANDKTSPRGILAHYMQALREGTGTAGELEQEFSAFLRAEMSGSYWARAESSRKREEDIPDRELLIQAGWNVLEELP